jgi:hypothetical protein
MVTRIVEKAYIEGVHRQQDKDLALTGFHPEFIMFVHNQDNSLGKVTLDVWFERIKASKGEDPKLWEKKVTFKFHELNIHSTTATVRLSVWKDGNYFATDIMLLYKIENNWKIVTKIFSMNTEPENT